MLQPRLSRNVNQVSPVAFLPLGVTLKPTGRLNSVLMSAAANTGAVMTLMNMPAMPHEYDRSYGVTLYWRAHTYIDICTIAVQP